MKGLDSMLKIWKRELGNPSVKDLTPQKIEQFLSHYSEKKGLSGSARNRHLTMLRAVFNKGIQWGLVTENPTKGIARLRENDARTRFLDEEEIKCLLEAASDNFKPILITALHSGMRRGEIFNLCWSDVDLKNRVLVICESKSGKKRYIPLDETLYEVFRVLPSRFKKGLVFPSSRTEGKWVDLKKQFRKTVDKAGIKEIRFHDLRHTFASHLVMNGVDLKTVQELLGHSSLTMTMRYSHLAPDHRMRAIKILDTAYQTDTKTDTVRKAGNSESS
jgi:integrase